MKGMISTKITGTLGLYLIVLPSYSASIIYGLDKASHFHSKSAGTFYIQVASFSNEVNAHRLQASLKQSGTPVLIKKGTLNRVLVGPMSTAAQVQAAAQLINSRSLTLKPTATNTKHRIISAKSRTSNTRPVRTNIRPLPKIQVESFKPLARPVPPATYIDKDIPSTQLPHIDMPPGGWFVGAGLGWIAPTGINSTNFASSGMPGFPDDRYVANQGDDALSFSLLAGYQWQRPTLWFPAYNLSLGYTQNTPSVKGVIYQNSLADAMNFEYKYNVLQRLLMATLKLDLYQWNHFMPYASVGAGVAINKTQYYADWPIPGATVQQRRYGFTSSTTTEFAGSIGAGLDYWIRDYAQLSFGYQFTSSQNVKTGYGQGSLSANQLTSKMGTNYLGIQAIYFVD